MKANNIINDQMVNAATKGDLIQLNKLITLGVDIHYHDDISLRRASSHGEIDIVSRLVELGADIHALDDHSLRWASCNGHIKIVKYLIDHGANIHANNEEALQWAIHQDHMDIVNLLIDSGSNLTNELIETIKNDKIKDNLQEVFEERKIRFRIKSARIMKLHGSIIKNKCA